METDLFCTDLLPLTEAARLLPRNRRGKAISIQTLRRWANRGIRGERLMLTFVGGRACVSREALSDFLSRSNEARGQIMLPSPSIAAKRAEAKLKRLGA